jgi:organic hydroperoxide reductase OsmC/OhrA
MEATQRYRVVAWWASGQTGLAKSDSAPNALHFSAPPEFGGLEGRWTPEDLLLGAIASCFTTTFRAIAEHSNFEYTDLEVEVEGSLVRAEKGYCMAGIVIRPSLSIPNEEGRERALTLLQKSKALCPVSRAVHITQELVPRVEVSKLSPA